MHSVQPVKQNFDIFLCFLLFALIALPSNLSAQTADTALVNRFVKKAAISMGTNPDSVLFFASAAFNLAKTLNYNLGVADSYKGLGDYNWVSGDYIDAISYYDSASQIFSALDRTDRLVATYTSTGISYSRLGNYTDATTYLLNALPLAEKFHLQLSVGKIYNGLGVIYRNQKKYDKALNAYLKSLASFRSQKSWADVAGCFTNMGIVKENVQQYDSAIHYQSKALHLFDSLQQFRGMVTCYNNLSNIFVAIGNNSTAMHYSEKSLAISERKGFFANQVSALSGLGTIHLKVGNLRRAEMYYLTAIRLAEKKNYRTELVNLFHALAECSRRQRKFEKAFGMYRKYSTLKDSIINQESLVRISMLEKSYDLAKKEASIALLQKDNQITKLYRNLVILFSVVVLLAGTLIFMFQRNKLKENQQQLTKQKELCDTQKADSDEQLRKAKIREELLTSEIEYKNKSLTTYALSMVQKNELLEDVRRTVEKLVKDSDSNSDHLKRLTRIVDFSITLDKDWDDFRLYFEDVHTTFFQNLRERCPDLGIADLRLCALIKLNLNMKQAAGIMRISPDSVKVARYRLRRKFDLEGDDNLTAYLMSL